MLGCTLWRGSAKWLESATWLLLAGQLRRNAQLLGTLCLRLPKLQLLRNATRKGCERPVLRCTCLCRPGRSLGTLLELLGLEAWGWPLGLLWLELSGLWIELESWRRPLGLRRKLCGPLGGLTCCCLDGLETELHLGSDGSTGTRLGCHRKGARASLDRPGAGASLDGPGGGYNRCGAGRERCRTRSGSTLSSTRCFWYTSGSGSRVEVGVKHSEGNRSGLGRLLRTCRG